MIQFNHVNNMNYYQINLNPEYIYLACLIVFVLSGLLKKSIVEKYCKNKSYGQR